MKPRHYDWSCQYYAWCYTVQVLSSTVLLRLAYFMSPGIDTIYLYQCRNANKSTKSLLVLKTPSHDVRRKCVRLLDHAQNALPFPLFFLFAFMTNFVCVCDAGRILPPSAEHEVQSEK